MANEYVISSLCPVCFACAWGVGVGLGRMRWGDCCGSAGSWRHEKGERLGLLTLGFDLDTTVVSLLSPAGHKLSSTDTIVAVFAVVDGDTTRLQLATPKTTLCDEM